MSLLIMTILVPIRGARTASQVVGLRRSVLGVAAWIVVYTLILSRLRLG
jgi:hypothetical protein